MYKDYEDYYENEIAHTKDYTLKDWLECRYLPPLLKKKIDDQINKKGQSCMFLEN